MNKIEEIRLLNEKILQCNKCKLNKLRGFGFGNPNSKIMFIAQNPGMQPENSTTKSEDIIPFSLNTKEGEASGKWFRNFLNEFGLTNDDFYITNIIKCPRTNSNDPPTEIEIENCREHFTNEFQIQDPTLIIGLGSPSKIFMKLDQNGQLIKKDEFYLISIWHPSYILRSFGNKFDEWIKQAEPIRNLTKLMK
jgi:uracil-DNA glycosylase